MIDDALHRRRFLAAGIAAAILAAPRTASAMDAAEVKASVRRPLPEIWDRVPVMPLWPDAPPETGFAARALPQDYPAVFIRNVARPQLRVFRPIKPNGRAILSIPGGAYTFVSVLNEGIDVAQRMTAMGYTVFVLVYRLPDEGWTHRADVPLEDAQRAIRLIRANARPYGLASDKIYAIGFSAGGHLAASLATCFAEQLYAPMDDVGALSARPDMVGLIYPVIAHTPGVGHAESTLRLLGPSPEPDAIARRSPAAHISAETPPIFLAHALDDRAVPAENTMLMMRAMQAADRPVEAHLFSRGGHGFGVGGANLPAGAWPDLLHHWIDDNLAQRVAP